MSRQVYYVMRETIYVLSDFLLLGVAMSWITLALFMATIRDSDAVFGSVAVGLTICGITVIWRVIKG